MIRAYYSNPIITEIRFKNHSEAIARTRIIGTDLSSPLYIDYMCIDNNRLDYTDLTSHM